MTNRPDESDLLPIELITRRAQEAEVAQKEAQVALTSAQSARQAWSS